MWGALPSGGRIDPSLCMTILQSALGANRTVACCWEGIPGITALCLGSVSAGVQLATLLMAFAVHFFLNALLFFFPASAWQNTTLPRLGIYSRPFECYRRKSNGNIFHTLPVSFPSIAFKPIKPHKSTIIIKNTYFSLIYTSFG